MKQMSRVLIGDILRVQGYKITQFVIDSHFLRILLCDFEFSKRGAICKGIRYTCRKYNCIQNYRTTWAIAKTRNMAMVGAHWLYKYTKVNIAFRVDGFVLISCTDVLIYWYRNPTGVKLPITFKILQLSLVWSTFE